MADTHIDPEKGEIKKPQRKRVAKPGQKATKEIKYYQQTARETFIPVAAMQRAVRHILKEYQSSGKARIMPLAFKMIQIAVEDYLTILFRSTQIEAIHAKRKTIQVGDMRTVLRVCKVMSGGHDLETEPVNPRMSEAHKKQCATAKRTRKRSHKIIPNKPVVIDSITTTTTTTTREQRVEEQTEVIYEEEMLVEEERTRQKEDIEQADDDWLLEEEDDNI